MAEENIYADNNVSITTARVMIGGTTYALRNITSVKMTLTPANKGCAILLLVIGIFAGLGALVTFARDTAAGFVWLLIGGGLVAGAIFWMRSLKPSFHVTIASSSGEIRALTSQDKAYISKIVAGINEAIVRYR